MYRNNFVLDHPPVLDLPVPFYGVHITPFLSIVTFISFLVPWGRIEWFIFCQICFYLPFPLVVFIALKRLHPCPSIGVSMMTFVLALVFFFSGQIMVCMGFPHYEIVLPAFLNISLLFLFLKQKHGAWVFLILASLVREDAGFHIFAILFMVLCVQLLFSKQRELVGTTLAMAFYAFSVSVIALGIQRIFWPGAGLFGTLYVGSPIFSHITWATFLERLKIFYHACYYIHYPFWGTVVCAFLLRDARILIGWAAYVPWFILNLLAVQVQKSEFSIYTGFVFITSIFWILLSIFFQKPAITQKETLRRARTRLAAFLCISLLSTIGWWRANPAACRMMIETMAWPKITKESIAHVHDLGNVIETDKEVFGQLTVDFGMASLNLTNITEDELFSYQEGRISPATDTVIYFEEGYAAQTLVNSVFLHGCDFFYHLPGTKIRLCSSRSLDGKLPGKMLLSRSFVLDEMRLAVSDSIIRKSGEIHINEAYEGGYALFGPYKYLPPGMYCVRWDISHQVEDAAAILFLDVAVHFEIRDKFPIPRTPARQNISFTFSLEPEDQDKPVEFRLWHPGGHALQVHGLWFKACSK